MHCERRAQILRASDTTKQATQYELLSALEDVASHMFIAQFVEAATAEAGKFSMYFILRTPISSGAL